MEDYIKIDKLKKVMQKISSLTGINNISINVNKTSYNKNCLMCYIRDPFENRPNNSHQNEMQIIEIANIFKMYHYNVDVIDYRSKKVFLTKRYDAVFDICVRKSSIYKNNMNSNAKRIAYFTGMESTFANNAEKLRIEDLYRRRGVYLQLRRQAPLIDSEVENFDSVIMIGNEYNFSSYNKFNLKKHYLVPNTGYNFPFVFDQNIKSQTSFMYFGSVGSVHKGLDLLLEVFAELGCPYKLYVCGGYENETDFTQEYDTELYHTDNIVPVGFVDIWSATFRQLCSECSFTILPSCSEACAGTITTCMSAGVVPICSVECGYEENEVITLNNCKKETIREAVVKAAKMSIDDIEEKSRQAIQLTKRKYNMQNFRKSMKDALGEVLGD